VIGDNRLVTFHRQMDRGTQDPFRALTARAVSSSQALAKFRGCCAPRDPDQDLANEGQETES
jgi:hypothetical protein